MTMSTLDTVETPTTTPAGRTTPAHFEAMSTALEPLLINRRTEISMLHLALVARVHIFFLSTPGTAKSMLVKEYMKRVADARTFMCMFNQFADDSLVFGPSSLRGFKEGRRTREYDGYLPTANLFFADEIWKASAALVNSLLQAFNERVFFDDGVEKPIPLWTMACASNELPESSGDLAAIYDRVPLRRFVQPITDPADMMRLLTLPAPEANPAPVLTWDHIEDAHAQAMALPFADGTREAFIDMLVKLAPERIELSGRRQLLAMQVAKANAWLAGATEVGIEHLDFLVDFLWDKPEQRPAVATVVLAAAAPLRAETQALSDTVAGLIIKLNQALQLDELDDARSVAGAELNRKLQRAAVRAVEIERLDPKGKAIDELDECWRHITSVHAQVQTMLFDLDTNQVSDIAGKARRGEFR